MNRFVGLIAIGLVTCLVACGDDDDDSVDAGQVGNPGFIVPEELPTAYTETGGVWEEVGPANFDCLNTASDYVALANDLVITGETGDFQTGDEVDNVDIAIFGDTNFSGTPIATATSDVDALYTMTVPAGHTRYAFRSTDPETDPRFLDTYLLNQYFGVGDDSLDLDSVSFLTAAALPAFIGVMRTEGLGILAGAVRDCDDNEISGVIATVSTNSCVGVTDCVPAHLDGAQTYYFSAGSSSLPVRLSQQPSTNKDGLFVVIELPPSSQAYLQVWGFTTMAEMTAGDLQLIAEISAPVLADSVIQGSLEPLRTE